MRNCQYLNNIIEQDHRAIKSRRCVSLGPTGKAYRAINQYTPRRLCRWLCRKHKVCNSGASRFPYEYLYGTLGLVKLTAVPADVQRAMA